MGKKPKASKPATVVAAPTPAAPTPAALAAPPPSPPPVSPDMSRFAARAAIPVYPDATFTGGGFDSVAELPRSVPSQTVPTSFTNTYTVTSGSVSDLNTKLATAAALTGSGNILINVPVATYSGQVTLPARAAGATGWIVIRSMGSIPAAGVRVVAANAAQMPTFTYNTISDGGAIRTATTGDVHHYALVGLEVLRSSSNRTTPEYGLVQLGSQNVDQTTYMPHDFIVDRCYIHGYSDAITVRGIDLNSGTTAIVNCRFENFNHNTAEAQAIQGNNGSGPYLFENNFIVGTTENLMLGGGDPMTPNVLPRDITVRRNYFWKDPAWYLGPNPGDNTWVVKNHLEFKQGERILITGNVFENCWSGDSQFGISLAFKSANQEGAQTWVATRDITTRYNKFSRCTFMAHIARQTGANPNVGVTLAQYVPNECRRLVFHDNLCDSLGNYLFTGGGNGRVIDIDTKDTEITNNTMILNGSVDYLLGFGDSTYFPDWYYVGPMTGFKMNNNIVTRGPVHMSGVGATDYVTAISEATNSTGQMTGNVIIGSAGDTYPSGNTLVAAQTTVLNADYSPKAPYTGTGADMTKVNAAIAGVV